MGKIFKVVFAFGIVMLLSVLLDVKVSFAATDEDPSPASPMEEDIFEDVDGLININVIDTLANSYFSNGKSFISGSGNKLTVSGSTQANSKVESIMVDLYLQRWDANRQAWITLVNVGSYTNSNDSFVKGSKNVTVKSGYYYRTRAHHRVSHKGTVEEGVSTTSSTYVK